MFFDDRLSTVLRQPATTQNGQHTQFRQLLDILGKRTFEPGGRRDAGQLSAAWLRMDALASEIPVAEREAMIREPSWRFRSPELAVHLVNFEPEIAAAALARAQLSADDWCALIPRLPIRARGFLRLRDDLPVSVETLLEKLGVQDRGLPAPTGAALLPQKECHIVENALPGAAAVRTGIDDVLPQSELPNSQPLSQHDEQSVESAGENMIFGHFETEPEADEAWIEEEAEFPSSLTDDEPFDLSNDAIVAAHPPFPSGSGQDAANDQPRTSFEDSGSGDEQSPSAPPADGSWPTDPDDSGRSEISALVERIAAFKRARGGPITDSDRSPRLPLGETEQAQERRITAFAFAADASGRIEWADAEVAAMVFGARLVALPIPGRSAALGEIERAVAQRQPIFEALTHLHGAPAVSGEWIVDAQPRFTDEGNFSGYVGRFRRPAPDGTDQRDRTTREADRIRQLLHELRTPVTAVQGYAEVIQQQLFGPAPHEYRALAAEIAADGARILAGFDQLDRLARLESGALEIEQGETDLAGTARATIGQIARVLANRMAAIDLDAEQAYVPIDTNEAEAFLWRFFATIAAGCDAGEVLEASLLRNGDNAMLACDLPGQLADEQDVFTADAKPLGSSLHTGLFGAGFTLRLLRAEARSAGGDLVRRGSRLELTLPLVNTGSDVGEEPIRSSGAAIPGDDEWHPELDRLA